jgi:hypothetical protein
MYFICSGSWRVGTAARRGMILGELGKQRVSSPGGSGQVLTVQVVSKANLANCWVRTSGRGGIAEALYPNKLTIRSTLWSSSTHNLQPASKCAATACISSGLSISRA